MEQTRVIVIGSGISGLTCAYDLARQSGHSFDLTVLEATERAGGLIRTEENQGTVIEAGPDTLLARKPAALELCRELGLKEQLVGLDPRSRRLMVVKGQELQTLPKGFFMMAPTDRASFLRSPLFSWWAKWRALREHLVPSRPASQTDESVAQFVARRFGRELLQVAAEPVMAGLYLGDADNMSLRMSMPRFLELEREFGNVTDGLKRLAESHQAQHAKPAFVALRHGMGTLVDALVAKLPPGRLRLRTAAQRVEPCDSGWKVHLHHGQTLEAEKLVLACPGHISRQLLRDVDRSLFEGLSAVQFASCTTVTLMYPSTKTRVPERSFGFFCGKMESSSLVAANFMSEKFPDRFPREEMAIRVFLKGSDLQRAADQAHGELERLGLVCCPPLRTWTYRYPEAMPQFRPGFHETKVRIQQSLKALPGLYLLGNAVGCVGIPDCVAQARATALEIYANAGLSGAVGMEAVS